ncbi:MAG: PTS system mannose/fructose/sorbose family transporter subunit IID [bacterium]|jgi:PTS system mannose-specific IID component|nr:PTS system mannose/fructose/sorbose family transporter subunit IID [candidate division KSB1 bacterium]MDH7561629.1 PTS system mannose/fructose/sorbose family transporter subunit IID [bacterium]
MHEVVRTGDLWRVWWRSFFIQGSWNFERMLALGFCFAILPIARRVARTEEQRRAFLQRHLQFFNTHPFTAAWVLGAVAKLEQQAVAQNWTEDRPIRLFKERLCGPLGAIGDTLFWSRAKPIAAMIGVILAMHLGWWGVIAFLLVYNVPHLWFRAHVLFQGFREGFDVVRRISVRRFQPYADRLATAGAGIVGLLLASGAKWLGPGAASSLAVGAGSALLSCAALRSGKVSVPAVVLALLVTGVLLGAAIG